MISQHITSLPSLFNMLFIVQEVGSILEELVVMIYGFFVRDDVLVLGSQAHEEVVLGGILVWDWLGCHHCSDLKEKSGRNWMMARGMARGIDRVRQFAEWNH